jgi:hypothetical protein
MRLAASDKWFAALVVISGLALAVTLVPGVFSIDECNHLAAVTAVRHGRLTLPGYEGISPSTELAFFNPRKGIPTASPPVNDLPPLYAFFALPFSYLGFRGLFLLNVLAFLAALVAVFVLVRRRAEDRQVTPWLAAGAFALGGHCIEYAQAMWPHMLSVCLCTAGFVFASMARGEPLPGPEGSSGAGPMREGKPRSVSVAGFLAGLLLGAATGVRYQNVVYSAGVGLGLGLWARERRRALAGYVAGFGLPLGTNSVLNYLRLGSFNPISKGRGYLHLAGASTADSYHALGEGGAATGGVFIWLQEVWGTFWYRVVDYSTCPPIDFGDFFPLPSRASGAYLFYEVAKKAWLQSSPWVAVVLASLILVWFGGRARRAEGQPEQCSDPAARQRQQELRAVSLVVWPVLVMFAFAGLRRTDGICFNQRYFLELVPLASVALGLLVERCGVSRAAFLRGAPVGVAAGIALGVFILVCREGAAKEMALMRVPLWLSAVSLLFWGAESAGGGGGGFARARSAFRTGIALTFVLGVCLGWSLVVHLGEDVKTARERRAFTRRQLEDLRAKVPDRSALLTWTYMRNAAAPLILERDVLIIDASRDRARDAPMLVEELMAQGRRVFLVKNLFERTNRRKLLEMFGVSGFLSGVVDLLELRGPGDKRQGSRIDRRTAR